MQNPSKRVSSVSPRISKRLASSSQGLGLDQSSLELLHHYSVSVSLTIASKDKNWTLCQVTVPQLAVQCSFVMNGILTVSALHLAASQSKRQRELITKGSVNENQALPSFREIMPNIDEENCHAVFAFSGLVLPNTLGSSMEGHDLDIRESGQELPNWMHLLWGTHMLLYQNRAWFSKGPFGSILDRVKCPIEYTSNPK